MGFSHSPATRGLMFVVAVVVVALMVSALGARPSNASRAPSSALRAERSCKFPPLFAGGAGLLGACSDFSDTLLASEAADPDGPGSLARGHIRNDPQIFMDVSAAVNACPHFTIFDDVAADVRDGIVTLRGKVTLGYKREEIEKRVAAVAGVRQVVVGQLAVLPASPLDDELRERIARAIYGNSNFRHYAMMPNPSIHIVVERSHVTLTGVARSDVDRRLAQALAAQFGALSVTNRLTTNDEREPRN